MERLMPTETLLGLCRAAPKAPSLTSSAYAIVVAALVFTAPKMAAADKGNTVDTDSVSCGSVNRGGLAHPAKLSADGKHHLIPAPWRDRDRRFGTDELIGLIRRASAKVASEFGGPKLGVGDLSRKRGGALPDHRSHQSGRDVDLHYYALSEQGKSVPPIDVLPYFRRTGVATHARAPAKRKIRPRQFDHKRNWALVAALATDEQTQVERIFVSLRIHRWLLETGRQVATSVTVAAVESVLRAGSAGQRHGDHLHVRIRCTEADRRRGFCRSYLAPTRAGGKKWRWGIRCPKRPSAMGE